MHYAVVSRHAVRNGIFHSHSRSLKLGTEFSTRIPVPENWEWNFHFHSRSRNLGMELSWEFPFPKIGNGIFHSHSRSQKLGKAFSTRIPVPKKWELDFPLAFPFPKFGNGICHCRSRSHSRAPLHPLPLVKMAVMYQSSVDN